MPKLKPEFEDGDSKLKISTGYDPRVPAVEIDPRKYINPDAATMVKTEYASNGENGETDQRRPVMRKVVSSVRRMTQRCRSVGPPSSA